MEIWFRWVLLVLGLLFVCLIVWDFFRQRKAWTVYEQELKDDNDYDALLDLTRSSTTNSNAKYNDESVPQSDMSVPRQEVNIKDYASLESEQSNNLNSSQLDAFPKSTKPSITDHETKLDSKRNAERLEESSSAEMTNDKQTQFISISVIARDENGFAGSNLINELTAAHLFHGKLNIFHRFASADGSGPVLFSLANAKEPGYFDISTMSSDSYHGLTLFFATNSSNNQLALDTMIKVAKQLSFRLNGELLDAEHQPLNKNTIEKYKEEIDKAS